MKPFFSKNPSGYWKNTLSAFCKKYIFDSSFKHLKMLIEPKIIFIKDNFNYFKHTFKQTLNQLALV